jgi:hypothetical protein
MWVPIWHDHGSQIWSVLHHGGAWLTTWEHMEQCQLSHWSAQTNTDCRSINATAVQRPSSLLKQQQDLHRQFKLVPLPKECSLPHGREQRSNFVFSFVPVRNPWVQFTGATCVVSHVIPMHMVQKAVREHSKVHHTDAYIMGVREHRQCSIPAKPLSGNCVRLSPHGSSLPHGRKQRSNIEFPMMLDSKS